MRSVLLISVLTLFALSNAQSCSNSCSYVYYNRTVNYTPDVAGRKELYRNTSSTSFRTGVFTINGLFTCSEFQDHLRFRRLNGNGSQADWQPLIIRPFASEYQVFGRLDSSNTISGKQTLGGWTDGNKMNLQISDHVHDSYSIYMNSQYLSYNYGDKWSDFDNKRLGTINNIFCDLKCMQFKYIMICNNTELKPKICEVSPSSEYQNLILGNNYSLRCGGKGVPFLEIDWKFNYSFGVEKKNARSSAEISSVVTTDDHTIKSQINITQFSLNDLGIYTCSVTNKNYKNSTSHTFTLDYKQGINVVASHTPKFYKVSDLPITFTWNITGNSFLYPSQLFIVPYY